MGSFSSYMIGSIPFIWLYIIYHFLTKRDLYTPMCKICDELDVINDRIDELESEINH